MSITYSVCMATMKPDLGKPVIVTRWNGTTAGYMWKKNIQTSCMPRTEHICMVIFLDGVLNREADWKLRRGNMDS